MALPILAPMALIWLESERWFVEEGELCLSDMLVGSTVGGSFGGAKCGYIRTGCVSGVSQRDLMFITVIGPLRQRQFNSRSDANQP